MFWLCALAGPYAIYKFITKIVVEASESRAWASGGGEHYNAQVIKRNTKIIIHQMHI